MVIGSNHTERHWTRFSGLHAPHPAVSLANDDQLPPTGFAASLRLAAPGSPTCSEPDIDAPLVNDTPVAASLSTLDRTKGGTGGNGVHRWTRSWI